MNYNSMGERIAALRKEKGMTQSDLAEKMGVTDKAVSKWERNLSCPDISLLPRLAELFGITLDQLMQTKNCTQSKTMSDLVFPILQAVPVAMGVAVTVLSVLNEIDVRSAMTMLGIGLACAGISQLPRKE